MFAWVPQGEGPWPRSAGAWRGPAGGCSQAWTQPPVTPPPPFPPQVTEISNVKCITRLPKETKRQAVAIVFTDDSARTFTCDSGMGAPHGLGWAEPGRPLFAGAGEGPELPRALQNWRLRSGTRCCRWSAWAPT